MTREAKLRHLPRRPCDLQRRFEIWEPKLLEREEKTFPLSLSPRWEWKSDEMGRYHSGSLARSWNGENYTKIKAKSIRSTHGKFWHCCNNNRNILWHFHGSFWRNLNCCCNNIVNYVAKLPLFVEIRAKNYSQQEGQSPKTLSDACRRFSNGERGQQP